jgi:hypothetical protein
VPEASTTRRADARALRQTITERRGLPCGSGLLAANILRALRRAARGAMMAQPCWVGDGPLVRVGTLACVVIAGAISECAPTIARWSSTNNATYDQWMKDRYACYNETQQRISGASVNQYEGGASSVVVPLCGAFYACLAARGYYRSDNGTLTTPQGVGLVCAEPN